MTFDEFIVKNKINLSDETVRMCEAAIEISRKSVSPLYDERHTFGILDNLDKLLAESGEIEKRKINFDVLLLAVCWHDVWKTKRFPINIFSLLLNQAREGIGSMDMFSNVAEAFGLDPAIAKKTKYAIRKHSSLQIFPLKSTETKILKDMDGLEEWSLDRLNPLREKYTAFGVVDMKIVKLVKFYFDNFMLKDTAKPFYFKWSKNEFERRKKIFLEEAKKVFEEYAPYLKKK